VPEGVEQVAADVATPDGARLACAGAAVVYHCAQPPYTKWVELFPPLTRAVLDGTADAGAKLVFADNLYVYGPPEGPPRIVTPCGAPLSGSDTATPPEPPLPTIRWRLLAPAAGRPRRLRHLR
jgi:hypothetical protein